LPHPVHKSHTVVSAVSLMLISHSVL